MSLGFSCHPDVDQFLIATISGSTSEIPCFDRTVWDRRLAEMAVIQGRSAGNGTQPFLSELQQALFARGSRPNRCPWFSSQIDADPFDSNSIKPLMIAHEFDSINTANLR